MAISVNLDQLDIVYENGLPDYRNACDSFSKGAQSLAAASNFFGNADINKYLPNALEISNYFYFLLSDASVLDAGYSTFSSKIAFLIYSLAQAEGSIDLSKYPDIQAQLETIMNLNLDESAFDKQNMAQYNNWVQQINDIKAQVDELMQTVDEDYLKQLGLSDEEIDKIIKSLNIQGVDKSNFNSKFLLPFMAFTFGALVGVNTSATAVDAVTGLTGDLYWTFTDDSLWSGATALGNIASKYAGAAGGALASLTIGALIAFEDGEFDVETFLEEGVAAAIGSAATGALTASLAAAGALTFGTGILVGLAGIGVTYVTSSFFHSIYYMPGDVPMDFYTWDEAKQRKYLKKELGIDLNYMDAVDKLIESGQFSHDEIMNMLEVCKDPNIIYSETCEDKPEMAALRQYMINKDYIDSCTGEEKSAALSISLNGTPVWDYQKAKDYMERFSSILTEA